ncbi:MAG: hypothetical protein LLH30_07155 [Candidatus Manganitrophus sp. SA1]|nr:hypothetical protein [Candidatus Manganitrophus morganii]
MKRYFITLLSFVSFIFAVALALPAWADQGKPHAEGQPHAQGQAQQEQMQSQLPPPDLLVIEIIPLDIGKGAGPSDPQGAMTLTKGKLTGEVVNIDKQAGTIDIKTEKGAVNSFNVEGQAKQQMEGFKKGDKVNMVLVLRAIEITPQGQRGMTQGQGK